MLHWDLDNPKCCCNSGDVFRLNNTDVIMNVISTSDRVLFLLSNLLVSELNFSIAFFISFRAFWTAASAAAGTARSRETTCQCLRPILGTRGASPSCFCFSHRFQFRSILSLQIPFVYVFFFFFGAYRMKSILFFWIAATRRSHRWVSCDPSPRAENPLFR